MDAEMDAEMGANWTDGACAARNAEGSEPYARW